MLVAVSGEVAVLGPIELFHIDAVLSLYSFLFQSPARSLRISFFCCCSSALLTLSLSLSLSLSVSLCRLLVLSLCFPSLFYDMFIIFGFLLLFYFTCGVLVCIKVGLQSICCRLQSCCGCSSIGFGIVCFESYC